MDMANLLYEIGTEEMPAQYMPGILKEYKELAGKKLAEAQSAMESVGDRTRILKKHLDRAEKFTKALDNTVESE
jgi:DNA recombination protein RmuC